MPYKGSRVLITGGAGFIGSNLARRLVGMGAKVTLVDSLIPLYGGNLHNLADIRDQISLNVSDVRDCHALDYLVRDKDFLFNLAGQTSHLDSMLDPFTDQAINGTAQLSVLEACRKHNPNVKIVFASTRQMYGKPVYLPVDEKHPINPVDVNGINKLAGEMYHILYGKVYGLKTCALRLTNTYGPRMRVKDSRQTFLGVWIKQLLSGERISVFGDGCQLRDFNFIDDCVDAFLTVALSDSANGKIYNLGSQEVVSLRDLAESMVGLGFGGSYALIPFPEDRKAIDIGDYYSDFSLIESELGWRPKVALREGLSQSLRFYKANQKHYWDVA